MTAQELLSNYAKAENEFFTATETIRKNKEILIKDFEEKNPGYYIKDIHTSNFTCNCNKFTSVYYNIKYRKRICIALCSYSIN